MYKIIVTGGAGFIGSHLCQALLTNGHKVLVIDNYLTGKKENLAPHPQLSIVNGSIADANIVSAVFEQFQPDILIHAAASYHEPDNWLIDIETNIKGIVNLLNSAAKVDVKKIIYYQTSLSYGLTKKSTVINNGHPYLSGSYSGGSSYAISKIAAELYLELSGISFISFRLANVYGPRNLSGPFPAFFQSLSNNIPCKVVDTKRDFIYIKDVINCTLKALEKMHVTGYFHIATGEDHSILSIFSKTVKAMSLSEKLIEDLVITKKGDDDTITILLDPSETKSAFGWVPETELAKGISETVGWYKVNPIKRTFTHLKIK